MSKKLKVKRSRMELENQILLLDNKLKNIRFEPEYEKQQIIIVDAYSREDD